MVSRKARVYKTQTFECVTTANPSREVSLLPAKNRNQSLKWEQTRQNGMAEFSKKVLPNFIYTG